MELVSLCHIATRWLLTLGEAAFLIWAVALCLALAGWALWCAAWMLRRSGLTDLPTLQNPFRLVSRDREAYRTRAER